MSNNVLYFIWRQPVTTDFKIELSQQHKTGIPGIDAQHKELLIMIDGFIDSLKNNNPSTDIIHDTIQEILGALRSHFATEESLLEMIAYPKLDEHKSQHKNFINMITGELEILENTDNSKICRFIHSYRHIALTHIAVFDREYTDFIEQLMCARKKFKISAIQAIKAIAG